MWKSPYTIGKQQRTRWPCALVQSYLDILCLGWLGEAKVSCFLHHQSNWYGLIVWQGLLSLQQVRVEGECFYFFCLLLSFIYLVLTCPSLSSPLLSLLSLFSLSLGDDTKWPTRVDVSLNPNTINQKHFLFVNICSFHWFCKRATLALIIFADKTGPDQPAQMCRLIRTRVVGKSHKSHFRALGILCLCPVQIHCQLCWEHKSRLN